MIYLDNAATTWPKPPIVIAAMNRFLRQCGANPGRSGHRLSIEAARLLFDLRCRIADLFGADDPLAVVFTKNATEAINLVLFGFLSPGDHVITSVMEHNSVLRPLRFLEERGVAVTRLEGSDDGSIDPEEVVRAVSKDTKLIVLNHASNVSGTLLDAATIGRIARERGLFFALDAAQTAGCFPIDMRKMKIDFLIFTGHKSLYGPQGTGGLCLSHRVRDRLRPLLYGGTGSLSDSDIQPDFLPDRFESGTLNVVGLLGLAAGVDFVARSEIATIRNHEIALTENLWGRLADISGVLLFGPRDSSRRTAIVSFNVDGIECSEVAAILDERYSIMCRAGLHCAPLAHRRLGTYPQGTVRFSMGFFNTADEIEIAATAIAQIAAFSSGGKS